MEIIESTETKDVLGTEPRTLASIPRLGFTVLFLLLTLLTTVFFASPGSATDHDPWEKLAGFTPTPGTLVQLGEGYAMGIERNADTEESAVVIYTTHDFNGCRRDPCLFLVIAFAVYDEDGDLVAFHQDPGSEPFEDLLKVSPSSEQFVSL